MRKNYKPIGNYIKRVDNRNSDLKVTKLLGLSMTKEFRETTSNIVGTDISAYKVMHKYQFACDFMSPIRVNKLPVVLKLDDEPNLVSPAYPVFEVKDRNELDSEYLMMWFRRPEFDRYATFKCDAAIRGGYDWDELCETLIPVPPIEKQREIVAEYNVIQNRINLNNQLIAKLEETAQAVYREWFVEGIDLENLPEGWMVGTIEDIAEFINRGITPSYSEHDGIVILNQKCVRNNSIDLESSKLHDDVLKKIPSEKYLKQYDILVNSTGDGTLGRVGIIKEIKFQLTVDSHITILRANAQNNPLYVWGNISGRSDEIANLAEGSTGQTELSRNLFSELPILIPDLVSQNKFANIISKMIKHSYFLETENQKLSELKELLLSRLATIEN